MAKHHCVGLNKTSLRNSEDSEEVMEIFGMLLVEVGRFFLARRAMVFVVFLFGKSR